MAYRNDMCLETRKEHPGHLSDYRNSCCGFSAGCLWAAIQVRSNTFLRAVLFEIKFIEDILHAIKCRDLSLMTSVTTTSIKIGNTFVTPNCFLMPFSNQYFSQETLICCVSLQSIGLHQQKGRLSPTPPFPSSLSLVPLFICSLIHIFSVKRWHCVRHLGLKVF